MVSIHWVERTMTTGAFCGMFCGICLKSLEMPKDRGANYLVLLVELVGLEPTAS